MSVTMIHQSSCLRVKKLSMAATLPSRGSKDSAGYDLFSARDVTIPSKGLAVVKLDIAVAVPPNTYGRIAPRSGLTVKHFIDVGAGVIDFDYRGPVDVALFNHGPEDYNVKIGDRIAQLIIEYIANPPCIERDELSETERGQAGFGSTGK